MSGDPRPQSLGDTALRIFRRPVVALPVVVALYALLFGGVAFFRGELDDLLGRHPDIPEYAKPSLVEGFIEIDHGRGGGEEFAGLYPSTYSIHASNFGFQPTVDRIRMRLENSGWVVSDLSNLADRPWLSVYFYAARGGECLIYYDWRHYVRDGTRSRFEPYKFTTYGIGDDVTDAEQFKTLLLVRIIESNPCKLGR